MVGIEGEGGGAGVEGRVEEPRWRRAADPRLAAIAEIRVDPALCADRATAARLEQSIELLGAEVAVFVTDAYRAVLAAELIAEDPSDPYILIRAATAEEAMSLHESDAAAAPEAADAEIAWRERRDSDLVVESAVVVWSGEVLFEGAAGGSSGPFYAVQAVAEAWAFHEALRSPRAEVCAAHAVSYNCAASFAARLLAEGDVEYRRLRSFFQSPIRAGRVASVWLPSGTR